MYVGDLYKKGTVFMSTRFTSVVVIGLGLIGASFAGAYHRAYPDAHITGVDTSSESLEEGLRRKWIQEAVLADDKKLFEAIKHADLVMISTPVSAIAQYFKVIADADYKGIITDTCSTKAVISKQAQEIHLPNNYIPGHPMVSKRAALKAQTKICFKAHTGYCALTKTLLQSILPHCTTCSRT